MSMIVAISAALRLPSAQRADDSRGIRRKALKLSVRVQSLQLETHRESRANGAAACFRRWFGLAPGEARRLLTREVVAFIAAAEESPVSNW